ncbi:dihydrofolate reductase family protein [uncultured Agrococcus sp.]|uniref:dihydrofolate reductase family protein n=1 Tax=uncultured Agrococcus sp. TaxID=382258 RepID=UPI0025E9398D|nr:dihydrofolate reductase family protein [uncultured Agrococcus sp.]
MMRELTYYVAVSLDGFIAGPNHEFDRFVFEGDHAEWLWNRYPGTAPTAMADAAGLSVDGGPFDTVLMGWNTYSVGLPDSPSPYGHFRQIVFSRNRAPLAGSDGVEFTDRDPVEMIRELKQMPGEGIWLCGGGKLAAALVDEIDRFAFKLNPMLFGDGVRVFGDRSYMPAAVERTDTRAFQSGVVLAEYSRRR